MSAITTRIGDLFRKLRMHSDPVEVDATHLRRQSTRPTRPAAPDHEELNGDENHDSPANGSPHGLLARLPGARRDAAIEKLAHGYAEVQQLMHAMRDHMDRQAVHNDRMLDLTGELARALATLPETNRNQTRMMENMLTHFDQSRRQSQQLSEAVASLAASGEHHTQVLGVLQQQLARSQADDQQKLQMFRDLNDTLAGASRTQQAGLEAMGQICRSATESQSRLEAVMIKTQQQMNVTAGLMCVTGLLTLVAFGAAAYALMLIAGLS